MPDGPPTNLRSLQARLRNHANATGQALGRVQRLIGVLIVGQMLSDTGIGVVKGGSNLEVRLGLRATRASSDLDVVRNRTVEEFRDTLAGALAEGWQGFGGRIVDRGVIAAPVPDTYRPHRFEVKLEYKAQAFQTVTLEVAVEEIDALAVVEAVRSDDGAAIFDAVGLPQPHPVLALSLDQQIAQKLHACTAPDEASWVNDRAHDLVDLQLTEALHQGPLSVIRASCERLFASRRRHPWPPTVSMRNGWTEQYAEEAEGLDVLLDIEAAVVWTNDYIGQITRA